jgi:hypothetical protein
MPPANLLVFTVDTNCELIKNEKLARHHKNESHHPHQKKKEERKITRRACLHETLFMSTLFFQKELDLLPRRRRRSKSGRVRTN